MAYKTIRTKKHNNSTIPQRKYLSMRIDKRLYSNLNYEGISLSGQIKRHRQRFKLLSYDKVKELFLTCITLDPLIFIRDGKPYISVPFEVQEKPILNDISIGVDLGERMMFVTSEGKAFKDNVYLREKRKIRYLRRCLQSKGTKSSKRHLKKIRGRERNLTNDMVKRSTLAIIKSTDASILILEDLSKIKSKTSKRSNDSLKTEHNRRLNQVPFYLFKKTLTNKAPLYGKKVETVSAYYTSQMDSRTDCIDGDRHGRRYYCCDGVVLDADWNAAVNIAKKGKHPFSIYVPLDGGVSVLNGRGLSTSQTSIR